MFGPRMGAFSRPAPSCAPSTAAQQIPGVMCAVPPTPAPQPPSPPAVMVRLTDALYSEITTGEVGFVHRESRVAFDPNAQAQDGSGNLMTLQVPSAQTLLISDVEFYAQAQDPAVAGDIDTLGARQLTGHVTLHVLVDDRAPIDLLGEIAPSGAHKGPIRSSAFSSLGWVLGGPGRQPHLFVKAREGQTVRLAYSVEVPTTIPVAFVGATLKGYVVPSAILAMKTAA